jgi:chemotaxis methyl-accepting protein methylase
MKKTLQECKEIVAKDSGWDNWKQLQNTLYMNDIGELTDLANKMYYEQSEWMRNHDLYKLLLDFISFEHEQPHDMPRGIIIEKFIKHNKQ